MIRLEKEKDYFEVENLTREAFWNVYRPGCCEHYVLHKLRNDECFVKELDYVLEKDGKIIANVVYAKGKLKTDDGKSRELLLFGPVSVLPDYQKKGYAQKLIEFTMNKAKELGYEAIVISGNPDYYKKYGLFNLFYLGVCLSARAKREHLHQDKHTFKCQYLIFNLFKYKRVLTNLF